MNTKIIIVDDHQLFIDGVKSILQEVVDIEIIAEAQHGLQCMRLLESGMIPDLILMDIRMPVMDGIATMRMLKKEYPKIQVLALSMYNQEADVLEMMDAGASGYIIKNTGKKELVEAIRIVSQKKSYFSKDLPGNLLSKYHEGSGAVKLLTRREIDILQLMAMGRTSHEIANALSISKFTVDTHRKNIHRKLRIATNAGLIKYTLENLNRT
ncbi:MAG TPA: response regulator transcription factor [Saprospiraceae bacterium]|nr:response regulator transcription factor [Saprospiraceae bacterium]